MDGGETESEIGWPANGEFVIPFSRLIVGVGGVNTTSGAESLAEGELPELPL